MYINFTKLYMLVRFLSFTLANKVTSKLQKVLIASSNKSAKIYHNI